MCALNLQVLLWEGCVQVWAGGLLCSEPGCAVLCASCFAAASHVCLEKVCALLQVLAFKLHPGIPRDPLALLVLVRLGLLVRGRLQLCPVHCHVFAELFSQHPSSGERIQGHK